MTDTEGVGQRALAESARAHALRAAGLSWLALSAVLAAILAMPHGWFDFFVPFGRPVTIPAVVIVAALIVAFLPLERLGDTIVGELRADDANGRLRNIAHALALAVGEPVEHVVVHEADTPNVGGFPTRDGVVVMATTQAIDQLRRDELEALVAAQFAGIRDRWCRIATRAELVWTLTIWLTFASVLLAMPIALFIGAAMVFSPRSVEATRDLCADVAAVSTTRHPAALASAMRHLGPSASAGRQQRLVQSWYLPLSPFLVMPRRLKSTTSVGGDKGTGRTWTDTDEVALELRLRADRAEALAAGADPREFTGREFRRRWSQLGTGAHQGFPPPGSR